ncbi:MULTISPECIES: ABC transporter ATP-binding protein [unclassified Streptomyces]|uniref:ABC transporter ATP-binding protein n=1 Tax=unclassified Streptomyces TaxID=2593676 RepID=UPI001BECF246|nr:MULTISPECIES: ABC transporter ATP-binding protein [unclassified Streptomyces]MBT2405022.1 ABC transporter ATP-binding protein [Streptomyces sp. ISL-21]MBT2457006.1 ABC transporter ATP-binding protein [Streptomyces sp. ISL-86]MBT2610748.1 ABC transporter ATP-binding protein [Streptomyces sp. ISL-87]
MPADTSPHGLASVAPEPGVRKPDPVLVLDGVTRAFGGLVAVRVDHLEVQRGTITALIGPNGAGKTTLFNVVSGFDRASSGSWSFDGHPLAGRPAHKIARHGMVRTFQLTRTLARLTVRENVLLAATGQLGERLLPALLPPLWRRQEREIVRRADELLDRFLLARLRDEYAGTLSGGQRKLLEMARALMAEPAMVLLDEPMAGVNPALTQSLLGHITALRDEGMTVLFVEHDMDVVMGISDWVACMADGRLVAEGPPYTVGRNPEVVDAYLGKQHDDPDAKKEERP